MDSEKSIKAIIIAHLDGELSGQKLQELNNWLAASNANAMYYAKIKDLWEASLADVSRIAETEKEWTRFLSKIHKQVPANFFRFRTNLQIIFRIAAVFIIGVFIGGLVIKYSVKDELVYMKSIAPKGSISQMVFADGTEVFLNAGSEIRYSPDAKQKKREVYLKGEAWFNVTKNKKNPFVVHTPFYDVNVTGTRFNVKAYEEDYESSATLEEGEIRISSSDTYKLAENIILKPGEQLTLDRRTKEINIRQVESKYYSSWKENKLIFLNMDFSELIVLLERKYGVEIKINDADILKYHYTGTIKSESILEILEIIKHTMPIQYKIEGQEIIINRK